MKKKRNILFIPFLLLCLFLLLSCEKEKINRTSGSFNDRIICDFVNYYYYKD